MLKHWNGEFLQMTGIVWLALKHGVVVALEHEVVLNMRGVPSSVDISTWSL